MSTFNYIDRKSSNNIRKVINKCITQYIEYIKGTGISKSTLDTYEHILRLVIGDFNIPLSQITTEQLNEYIAELYKINSWSDTYIKRIISTTAKFLIWCKSCNYIATNHILINPIDGVAPIISTKVAPISKDSFVSKKTDKSLKPVVKLVDENVIKKSTYNDTITNTVRDVAIQYLFNNIGLTAEEISDLNIYDFLHNKIVIQSFNSRINMRIIPISAKTRNLIYNYLSTREDNNEALFLSERRVGDRISVIEVTKLISK